MKKLRLSILILAISAFFSQSFACTSILVTRKASKNGSTMITYAADSHTRYGDLYYLPGGVHKPGEMIQIFDYGDGRPLIQIPQVERTFTVIRNANEVGLGITETTFGGRAELESKTPAIDYGSLIRLALQRASSAREAIKVIAELTETYGYCSSGESFSIADDKEVWIMEIIGKGEEKGAVWVAMKIPEGYISAHANHARITTFPLQSKKDYKSISSKNLKHIFRPEVEVVYSHDVITFARKKGYFTGKDQEFSFSDTYAPINFSAARGCEARVWSIFRRCNSQMQQYEDYALGYNLQNRMPLWIVPDQKLTVQDVMELMRDHFQGTKMDMRQDLGAGPFNCPYRWRPMDFTVNGQEYVHERAISTQQTGFSMVIESREHMPTFAKGLMWFGVDDTYSTVYMPIYTSMLNVNEHLQEGNGAMIEYSESSMFWLFNFVTNFAYTRYSDMIKDIRKVQKRLEASYMADVNNFDKKILRLYKDSTSENEIKQRMTNFSNQRIISTFYEWTELKEYLIVKYIDGNIKKEKDGKFIENPYRKGQCVMPEQPQYPAKWYETIVKDNGEILKVKK
ncbi:MAG: C69 family dipeptidase [Bacteroidales bacterium]|nr:C69 family dipeptidase [Bacteroidales bacterium]